MALFKKNEEYEDDSDFDEVEEKGNRKFTKNFKDLSPKNRRKRKEPSKPWGKKERLVVLIFLLLSVIVSAGLALGIGKGWNGLKFPSFNFSSLNIFKEQTIIIEKK
ncbi:MAG: hypothetical protein ABSE04_01940 [Candidatus Microgenomates bacterium]|jgi:hypothetical protein